MRHSRRYDFQDHPRSGSRWEDDLSPLLGLFSFASPTLDHTQSIFLSHTCPTKTKSQKDFRRPMRVAVVLWKWGTEGHFCAFAVYKSLLTKPLHSFLFVPFPLRSLWLLSTDSLLPILYTISDHYCHSYWSTVAPTALYHLPHFVGMQPMHTTRHICNKTKNIGVKNVILYTTLC